MKLLQLLFLSLSLLSCSKKEPQETTFGIQVFGEFDTHLVDTICASIKSTYGFNTIILNKKGLPKSTFVNIKSPRYRADEILKILKDNKPDSIDYVIGLIDKDISTTKKDKWGNTLKPESKYLDWGVFGLGYRPGPSCIVSTFRIKTPNKTKYHDRIKKICMHEIGHNLGLPHCSSHKKCVMRDAAETIRTIDQVDLLLCENCKRSIQ